MNKKKIILLIIIPITIIIFCNCLILYPITRIKEFNNLKRIVEEGNYEVWDEFHDSKFERNGVTYQECPLLSPKEYRDNEIIAYELWSPWWTNGQKGVEIRKSTSLGEDVLYFGDWISEDEQIRGYSTYISESLDWSKITIHFDTIIRYDAYTNEYLKDAIDYSYNITNKNFYKKIYNDDYLFGNDRICGIKGTINDDIEIHVHICKTKSMYYIGFDFGEYYRKYEMEEELVNYLKQFSQFK